MKADKEIMGLHLRTDYTHPHTQNHPSGPYLQLSPQLLHMGGVLRQVFPLGGAGQNVDGRLRLLEPFQEALQLSKRHLQALQFTVQLSVAVTGPAGHKRRVK